MSSVPPASAFIVRLAVSYVAGTFLAPVLWSLPAITGKWEGLSIQSVSSGLLIVAALSFMLSFKYFLAAFVLGLLFRRSVFNHLLVWSAVSIVAVPVLWLAEVYFRESRGRDLLTFLKSDGGGAAFVGCYVFVYVAIFFAWNRIWRGRHSMVQT